MTDLFEEVEEQLRSDQYKRLARRALPWVLGIVGLALAGTLGYWGWDTWRTQQTAKAGDRAKATTLWTEISKSQAPAYKALALMHLAGDAERANKRAEAVKLYDEAAEASPDPVIGDAARLKSAFALLDTAPLSETEARLKPLMEEGKPYRIQAREALAFAKLNAGDAKGARGDFVLISQSLDASQGAQSRAQAAIGLIDSGSAKAVPAVVKSAASLPPPMMIDPGAAMGGPPQPQANAPQ